ncbi:2Fe-2S iron-sulfur cluster binding domain-containing protein [Labrenzia sp. PHM005]|nr:2Fe-2S iron-sulfur cluster binding domain-containing protein [Labrenzia sp. PHM005]
MIQVLQIGGGLVLLTVLVQGCLAVYGQFSRIVQERRMAAKRLEQFQSQAKNIFQQAELDRSTSELTWSGKRKFRIVSKIPENKSGDICSFYLAPHDGGSLPPFSPGQFLTFELQIPGQAKPVVRCYSLSNSPANLKTYRVSIKRIPPPPDASINLPAGLSSGFFHSSLNEGDVVDVLAPSGQFVLNLRSERPVVLIAGGVGLTPILSMLKWLSDKNSHRETWIFYAVRNGEDIAFRDEIRKIITQHDNFHAVFAYSRPTEECVEGVDFDCAGFVTTDLLKQYLNSSNYEFYICGPPPMMEMLTAQLSDWGVPDEDINFEAFGPASVKKTQHVSSEQDTGDKELTVEFARSGKSVTWTAANGTILDLAEENGVTINCGCRAGNCGTCATAVKSGNVSYVAKSASTPAQGTALVCIARPEGDLVLDA